MDMYIMGYLILFGFSYVLLPYPVVEESIARHADFFAKKKLSELSLSFENSTCDHYVSPLVPVYPVVVFWGIKEC
jgi:hypothetical protein